MAFAFENQVLIPVATPEKWPLKPEFALGGWSCQTGGIKPLSSLPYVLHPSKRCHCIMCCARGACDALWHRLQPVAPALLPPPPPPDGIQRE